eukprot:3700525-Amphidinium_carterae.2
MLFEGSRMSAERTVTACGQVGGKSNVSKQPTATARRNNVNNGNSPPLKVNQITAYLSPLKQLSVDCRTSVDWNRVFRTAERSVRT